MPLASSRCFKQELELFLTFHTVPPLILFSSTSGRTSSLCLKLLQGLLPFACARFETPGQHWMRKGLRRPVA